MATHKISQKELEEMIREMVSKAINEVPGEAPIMERKKKKSSDDEEHMTPSQIEKREDIALAIKKKIGKKEFEKRSKQKWNNPYAIATAAAMKSADENLEEKAEFTDKYDKNPALKGKQSELPDHLQKAIIKKKGGKTEEEEEELDEKNLSLGWKHSASGRSFKKTHQIDGDKLKKLEERKRAIIKQLEELKFYEGDSDTEVLDPETDAPALPSTRPSEPSTFPDPWSPHEKDRQNVPSLVPQGRNSDMEELDSETDEDDEPLWKKEEREKREKERKERFIKQRQDQIKKFPGFPKFPDPSLNELKKKREEVIRQLEELNGANETTDHLEDVVSRFLKLSNRK